MIFSLSCLSCGTPYTGCIACLSTIEKVTDTYFTTFLRDLAIILVRMSIDDTVLPLYLVRKLFLNVECHFGILAACILGKNSINCSLPKSSLYLKCRTRHGSVSLIVIGI